VPKDLKRREEKGRQMTEQTTRLPNRFLLDEVKLADAKELRQDDFNRKYFKGKENKLKKYGQVEEIRRLFKEVL
jgi:hypothetical protein